MMDRRYLPAAALLAVVALLCCANVCSADQVVLEVQDASGSVGSTADVTIAVRDPQGLGAAQFDLGYDSTILGVEGVEGGEGLPALIDHNVVEDGVLRVALASNEPISADGPLVIVKFQVLAEGQSDLALSAAEAWEQETSYLLPVGVEDGTFTGGAGGRQMLLIGGLIVAVVGIALVGLVFRSRRRK